MMSATVATCPRKRSDMTPCVVTDGENARADDGVCVGCGVSVPRASETTEHEPNCVHWSGDPDHCTCYRDIAWPTVGRES